MSRYSDVHPDHIDPETGRPYANYSSHSLEEPFRDDEDDYDACTDRRGHRWVCSDEDEEITYCQNCGADGNG